MDKDRIKAILSWFAVISALVVLISYGSITNYYAGYLHNFGVNIGDIDFWPHLTDFSIIGFSTVTATIVLVIFTWLIILLNNWISKKIAKNASKSHIRTIGECLYIEKGFADFILIAMTIILAFSATYSSSYKLGVKNSEQKTIYIQVASTDSSTDLLIYQNNGIGIIKTYQYTSSKFDSGYQTIDMSNRSFTPITVNPHR